MIVEGLSDVTLRYDKPPQGCPALRHMETTGRALLLTQDVGCIAAAGGIRATETTSAINAIWIRFILERKATSASQALLGNLKVAVAEPMI